MSRTNTKQVVFIIFLWSFAVHLPGLFSPLLDNHAYRQCQNRFRWPGTMSVTGMNFLNPEIDTAGVPQRTGTEFPVYSYILAAGFKVFGVHEILGRLLSMVGWPPGEPFFLFLFVKRRLRRTHCAVGAPLVMCALPIHIYFTRTVQPEPMALWGLLGFLCYADRWLYTHPRGKKLAFWLSFFWRAGDAPEVAVRLYGDPALGLFGLGVFLEALSSKNTAWWAALAADARARPLPGITMPKRHRLASYRSRFKSIFKKSRAGPDIEPLASAIYVADSGTGHHLQRAALCPDWVLLLPAGPKHFSFFAAWLVIGFPLCSAS